MEKLHLYNEILSSYKRCTEIGLRSSITSPTIILNEEDLKIRLNENMVLINVFNNCVENILKQIKGEYIFLLTDDEGNLLDIRCNDKAYSYIDKSCFNIGMSFKEESLGTNAISMAMRLKEPVYLMPQDHYCDILKKWYCIAAPLIINEKIMGYLDVSTIEHSMADEMVVFTELLAYQIENEYKERFRNKESSNIIKLSKEQLKVLKLIVRGYKDSAIAHELKISTNTVNYHKRNIFKKLGVCCTREAKVKAIQMHLVEID